MVMIFLCVASNNMSITVIGLDVAAYIQLDIFSPYNLICEYPPAITHYYTLGYCYSTVDGDSYKIYIAKLQNNDDDNDTVYMTGIETWNNVNCLGERLYYYHHYYYYYHYYCYY